MVVAGTPLDQSILLQLILACARYERARRSDPEVERVLQDLEESLATIFHAIASVLAVRSDWSKWAVDRSYPGYLIGAIGQTQIRIPWNLAADIPAPDFLSELLSFASRIRSNPRSAICLSGSSAAASAWQWCGDIDFCEYVRYNVEHGHLAGFAQSVRNASNLCDENLVCLGLEVVQSSVEKLSSVSRTVQVRPWAVPPCDQESFMKAAVRAVRGKCEFVAQSKYEGAIEVSNVVLVVGHPREGDKAEDFSFPMQEVPVDDGHGWIPRRLTEPLVLGRYVNWLYDQVCSYLMPKEGSASLWEPNLNKAAKRAFPLTRLLFLADWSQKLRSHEGLSRELLRASLLAKLALRERVRELEDDVNVHRFESVTIDTVVHLLDQFDPSLLPRPSSRSARPAETDRWCLSVERVLRDFPAQKEAGSLIQEFAEDIALWLG